MAPASLVAWRWESLKYAGTVITADLTFFDSPRYLQSAVHSVLNAAAHLKYVMHPDVFQAAYPPGQPAYILSHEIFRVPVKLLALSGTHACAVSRILASTMDEISSAEKRFFSPLYSTVHGTGKPSGSDPLSYTMQVKLCKSCQTAGIQCMRLKPCSSQHMPSMCGLSSGPGTTVNGHSFTSFCTCNSHAPHGVSIQWSIHLLSSASESTCDASLSSEAAPCHVCAAARHSPEGHGTCAQ